MGRPKGSKNLNKQAEQVLQPIPVITGEGITGSSTSYGVDAGLMKIGSLNKQGNFGVSQTSSFFYSPELTTESWLLPKSRQETCRWARVFYNLNPIVHSVINMHSKYPFSKFEIVCGDPTVKQFYEQMAFNKNFNLYDFMLQASLSYEKFGEALCFGTMEKKGDKTQWTKFVLLEPELIDVKSDMMSGKQTFEMVPTAELKALVTSTRPEDADAQKQLEEWSPEIVKAIRENRNIRLSDENVSIIANLTDPSATRGTSRIQCLFKDLILNDFIRLAQMAYAQRYVFPVEMWSIGDIANNIIPSTTDLQNWKQLINQSIQQPPFSLVTPPYVKYEALSTAGKTFPVNTEWYEYTLSQLMIGLGVNKNLMTGDGPSFSAGLKGMSLHRLMMEYKAVRDKFEDWIIHHFFEPIAEKNGFYTTENGEKKLILPEISWKKSLDIEDAEAERDIFVKMWEAGVISTETLFTKFPTLDFKTEQKKLELERGTIFDKGDGARLPEQIHKSVVKPGGDTGFGGKGGVGEAPGAIKPIKPIKPGQPGEVPEGGEAVAPGAPEGGAPAGTPAEAVTPATPIVE
jgi:hypothetical protein